MLIAFLAAVMVLMVAAGAHDAEGGGAVRARLSRVWLYFALAGVLILVVFPFWWIVDTSFKHPVDILVNSIVIVAVSVAVSLTLGTLAAYSLARFRMRLGLNQSALVVAPTPVSTRAS